MVWYSYHLQNFPKFAVIHTVKGFSVVNEPEVDGFLIFSCFFYDPTDVGIDSWFLWLFKIQLEPLVVLGSYTVEI